MELTIEKAIDFFQQNDVEVSQIIIDKTIFNSNQLKTLDRLLKALNDKSEMIEINFKYKTSRRRGLIVVLEEDFYDKVEYGHIDLKDYERKASVKFAIQNRNTQNLDTPEKVHPKNPCVYYQDNGKLKRHYREALKGILKTSFQFFEENSKAHISLERTYTNLKDC